MRFFEKIPVGKWICWKRAAFWCFTAFLLLLMLLISAGEFWQVMFVRPCRVSGDCKGKGIDMESVKAWEDQEMGQASGIGIREIAAWRRDEDQVVSSVSTGRSQQAEIFSVYGAMELVHPAKILCGRYGLAEGEEFCVLSEALARSLFGGTEAAGEWVTVDSRKLQVTGVIQWDRPVIMMKVEEGEVESTAAQFQGRMGAGDGFKRFLGELSGF